MNKALWILKQLLPLSYRTHYMDEAQKTHFSVWRMWFGRCFAVDDVVVDPGASGEVWRQAHDNLLRIQQGAMA